MVDSDPVTRGDGQYWYAVEIRSHGAPVTGNLGVKIGGTKLRAVEFEVPVDETEVAQSGTSALATAERHRAAHEAVEAVVAGMHDWPWGKYLVTVRGRESASTYVADIDADGTFTLQSAEV